MNLHKKPAQPKRLSWFCELLVSFSELVRRQPEHFLEAADKLPRVLVADLFADLRQFPVFGFQKLGGLSQLEILEGCGEGASRLLLKHPAEIGVVVVKVRRKTVKRDRPIVIVHVIDHVEKLLIPDRNVIQRLHRIPVLLQNVGDETGQRGLHQLFPIGQLTLLLFVQKQKHAFGGRILAALKAQGIRHGRQMGNAESFY